MTNHEGIHRSLHVRSAADVTISRRLPEEEAWEQAQHDAAMRARRLGKETREKEVPAL